MRPFKLPIFLIIGIHITSSLSNPTDVKPYSNEGLCVYNDDSGRYTCDLYNAVINSPDEILTITGNHLPNHSDSDVQVVIHRNVSITHFNGEVLRKFINLEYLALGPAGVLQISENAFDVCGKLDHIYIGINPLLTFPPAMLQYCVNLRHLHLYYNQLTTVPEDLFGTTTNLEIFQANSNQLTSLPRNLLRNMRNLKEFLVPSNSITNIDENFLVNAVNLDIVDVSNNPITDHNVIPKLLDGHSTLKTIKIDGNHLHTPFTFFSQFTQLTDLVVGDAGEALLTGIDWKSLPTSLTYIYASNIGEEIQANAFSHLTNLKSLAFTGTGITNLHDDTFSQLGNLNTLSIQSTRIRTIPSNIFVNQTKLTQLYLSFNDIEELPEGLFVPLVNLGLNGTSLSNDLVLSGNRIRRLNANSFGSHSHLKNIKLSFNVIDEIERDLFTRLPNPMSVVDLTSNNCTDVLFWFESNLYDDKRLENCFNNWAGIRTTMAPSGASKLGAGFSLSMITIILILFSDLI